MTSQACARTVAAYARRAALRSSSSRFTSAVVERLARLRVAHGHGLDREHALDVGDHRIDLGRVRGEEAVHERGIRVAVPRGHERRLAEPEEVPGLRRAGRSGRSGWTSRGTRFRCARLRAPAPPRSRRARPRDARRRAARRSRRRSPRERGRRRPAPFSATRRRAAPSPSGRTPASPTNSSRKTRLRLFAVRL